MKPLLEKLDAHSPHWKMTNIVNAIIDHLTDYEKRKQDNEDKLYEKLVEVSGNLHTMYTELDNRIQTIANNQLEMKRGTIPVGSETEYGFEDNPYQPKRWRAKLGYRYYYIDSYGDAELALDTDDYKDKYLYATGNYHQTREAAEAYKARLLELGKEI